MTTTIQTEINRAIANQQDFMPPPLVNLAQKFDVPPSIFRQWFINFRLKHNTQDWYLLDVALYCAFLKSLELEGLVRGN